MTTTKHPPSQTTSNDGADRSKVLEMPDRRPRSASGFDLMAELKKHPERYVGKEQWTFKQFPNYLDICLKGIRGHSKTDFSSMVACCMSVGREFILANSEVKTLFEIKQQALCTSSKPHGGYYSELAGWLRNFPLSIPSFYGEQRLEITVPFETVLDLQELAIQIGTSRSIMATLAIISTLETQPDLSPEERYTVEYTMSKFFERAHWRGEMAKVMMPLLKVKNSSS